MSTLSIAPSPASGRVRRAVATAPRSSAAAAQARVARVPAKAGAARSSTPPLRLTRRGRVVLTVLMLAAALTVLTLFSGHSAASGEASDDPVRTRSVVVGEGDTLWGLAAEVAEPGEIREVVHQIQKLNSLPGPELVEGQALAVPVR